MHIPTGRYQIFFLLKKKFVQPNETWLSYEWKYIQPGWKRFEKKKAKRYGDAIENCPDYWTHYHRQQLLIRQII